MATFDARAVILIGVVTVALFKNVSSQGTYDGWTQPSFPLMPRGTNAAAIGYDMNNTIYILGGSDNRQLVSYDIEMDSYTDLGLNYFPFDIGGLMYQQVGDIIYMMGGTKINIFNVNTKQFVPEYNNISIPSTTGRLSSTCLAITDNYLFIVGGWIGNAISDIVHILDISSNIWFSDIANTLLPFPRYNMPCIAHNDKLYVIGGQGSNYLSQVLKLFIGNDLINIRSQTWNELTGSLSEGMKGTTAVVYGNDIITFGGYLYDSNRGGSNYLTDINVIDTTTDTVVSGGDLVTAVFMPMPIIVNGIIYVFGGQLSPSNLQTYQYMNAPPTSEPTKQPTEQPTIQTTAPTPIPTATTSVPTQYPTSNPTLSPTENPTNIPTDSPTNIPTDSPTNIPTDSPTNIPTNIPTSIPSNTPIYSPSDSPTEIPTNEPTGISLSTEEPIGNGVESPNKLSNIMIMLTFMMLWQL